MSERQKEPKIVTRGKYLSKVIGTGAASVLAALTVPFIANKIPAVVLYYINMVSAILFVGSMFLGHEYITEWTKDQLEKYDKMLQIYKTLKDKKVDKEK